MNTRYRMAKRMGLPRYMKLLGKRMPLRPEDEKRLIDAAARVDAARDSGTQGKG